MHEIFPTMLTAAAILFAAVTFVTAQSQATAPMTVDAAKCLPEWDTVFSYPRCADCLSQTNGCAGPARLMAAAAPCPSEVLPINISDYIAVQL
ncbi:hypothetical protein [Mesorhizobium ventifaucium]|uniref:Uncharacterized protein n=1 Tax=Mesorhizobium ventifaucium TaxID=666020 RepID=A0ABM9DD12_9HYPH|nr:hypothetical protein [Mesorhizobium ventifaucium]CAH2394423.1 exported hypothetical protein [Mesorhizobium ventifaucium]